MGSTLTPFAQPLLMEEHHSLCSCLLRIVIVLSGAQRTAADGNTGTTAACTHPQTVFECYAAEPPPAVAESSITDDDGVAAYVRRAEDYLSSVVLKPNESLIWDPIAMDPIEADLLRSAVASVRDEASALRWAEQAQWWYDEVYKPQYSDQLQWKKAELAARFNCDVP